MKINLKDNRKLNHHENNLEAYKCRSRRLKEETLKTLIPFYLRLENVLSRALSCEEHTDKDGPWCYIPYDTQHFTEILQHLKKHHFDGHFANRTFLDVGCGLGVKVFLAQALNYTHYGDFDVIFAYQPIRDDKVMHRLLNRIVKQMKKGAFFMGQISPEAKEAGLTPMQHDNLWRKD